MILEEKYIEGAEDATQVKLRQLGLSVGGIPDDVHVEEFGEIIKKIDADGVSDYHVERYGMDMIWDYRMFDLEAENCLLNVGNCAYTRGIRIRRIIRLVCHTTGYPREHSLSGFAVFTASRKD